MLFVQGDIFLVAINVLPQGITKIKRSKRGYVLAAGEHTGHAHVIEDDLDVYQKDGILYLRAEKTIRVTHEEHQPIIIEPGIWQVGRVQEYDPFMEETKNVQD